MISQISETYMLANKARAKLTKEASRGDHDLRILVAHANLLDNLMEKISNNQFDDSIKTTFATISFNPYENKTTVTFIQDDSDSDSSDDEDEFEEDDDENNNNMSVTMIYDSDEDSDYSSDEDFDEGELKALSINLTRVNSNFRKMPTINELSEQELDELENYQSDSEEEEEEEVDIVDLKKTPSLNYSSSTEDEEEDDHEEDRYDEVDFTEQGTSWNKSVIATLPLNDSSIIV